VGTDTDICSSQPPTVALRLTVAVPAFVYMGLKGELCPPVQYGEQSPPEA
jgi:hypothetical protein